MTGNAFQCLVGDDEVRASRSPADTRPKLLVISAWKWVVTCGDDEY
jgi:hypothetical protein